MRSSITWPVSLQSYPKTYRLKPLLVACYKWLWSARIVVLRHRKGVCSMRTPNCCPLWSKQPPLLQRHVRNLHRCSNKCPRRRRPGILRAPAWWLL